MPSNISMPEISKERQKELEAMSDAAYRQSPEWNTVRTIALAQAGYRCRLCGGNENLHAHHKTYEVPRGYEHIHGAIMIVCNKCHFKLHRIERSIEAELSGPKPIIRRQYEPVSPEEMDAILADVFAPWLRNLRAAQ